MMVGSCGLEPQTSCVSSRRSNQLSYEPKIGDESGSYGQQTSKSVDSNSFPTNRLPCQGSVRADSAVTLPVTRSFPVNPFGRFLGSRGCLVAESGANGQRRYLRCAGDRG